MVKLTPDSARDFLASEFWKDWQALAEAMTFERWKDAKTMDDREALRRQVDHLGLLEEAMIRLAAESYGGRISGSNS